MSWLSPVFASLIRVLTCVMSCAALFVLCCLASSLASDCDTAKCECGIPLDLPVVPSAVPKDAFVVLDRRLRSQDAVEFNAKMYSTFEELAEALETAVGRAPQSSPVILYKRPLKDAVLERETLHAKIVELCKNHDVDLISTMATGRDLPTHMMHYLSGRSRFRHRE